MGRCGDHGGHIPAEGDGLTGSDFEVGCGCLRWLCDSDTSCCCTLRDKANRATGGGGLGHFEGIRRWLSVGKQEKQRDSSADNHVSSSFLLVKRLAPPIFWLPE